MLAIVNLNELALDSLPTRETDAFEYKSGLTDVKELNRKVQKAASAFWNSGGGVFLVGITDDGTVDGGIDKTIGRQTLDDWLSHVLLEVTPPGEHDSREFDQSAHANIEHGKCVWAIQFLPSSAIPHQSADKKYYIRAGAHSVPASHFIIESLYAKRNLRNPQLVHLVRLEYFTVKSDFLRIEVIAATDGVALDARIDLMPRSNEETSLVLPIEVPLIDREHPFGFRIEVAKDPPFCSVIKIQYSDFKKESYTYEGRIDPSKCVAPYNLDSGELGKIAGAIRELNQTIDGIRFGMRA